MSQALWRLARLYQSIKRATSRRASALVAKRRRLNSSSSRAECQASTAALSKQDPTRPADWVTPSASQACLNSEAVNSALSEWKMAPLTSPPLMTAAILSAPAASSASWCSPMANPGTILVLRHQLAGVTSPMRSLRPEAFTGSSAKVGQLFGKHTATCLGEDRRLERAHKLHEPFEQRSPRLRENGEGPPVLRRRGARSSARSACWTLGRPGRRGWSGGSGSHTLARSARTAHHVPPGLARTDQTVEWHLRRSGERVLRAPMGH